VKALTSNAAVLTDGASLVRQAAARGLHLSHTTACKFGKSVLAEEAGRAAMAAKDYYALLQKLHTRAPPQGHATVAAALPAPSEGTLELPGPQPNQGLVERVPAILPPAPVAPPPAPGCACAATCKKEERP